MSSFFFQTGSDQECEALSACFIRPSHLDATHAGTGTACERMVSVHIGRGPTDLVPECQQPWVKKAQEKDSQQEGLVGRSRCRSGCIHPNQPAFPVEAQRQNHDAEPLSCRPCHIGIPRLPRRQTTSSPSHVYAKRRQALRPRTKKCKIIQSRFLFANQHLLNNSLGLGLHCFYRTRDGLAARQSMPGPCSSVY